MKNKAYGLVCSIRMSEHDSSPHSAHKRAALRWKGGRAGVTWASGVWGGIGISYLGWHEHQVWRVAWASAIWGGMEWHGHQVSGVAWASGVSSVRVEIVMPSFLRLTLTLAFALLSPMTISMPGNSDTFP